MTFFVDYAKKTAGNFDKYYIETAEGVIRYTDGGLHSIRLHEGEKIDVSKYPDKFLEPCAYEDLPKVLQLLIKN